MSAYAEAAAGVGSGSRRGLCVANGCPLPGSLSLSTTGTDGKWYCHLHLRTEPSQWGNIAARANMRRELFELARQLRDTPRGSRPSESTLLTIKSLGGTHLITKESRVSCNELGSYMMQVLTKETLDPQQPIASPARDYNPDD